MAGQLGLSLITWEPSMANKMTEHMAIQSPKKLHTILLVWLDYQLFTTCEGIVQSSIYFASHFPLLGCLTPPPRSQLWCGLLPIALAISSFIKMSQNCIWPAVWKSEDPLYSKDQWPPRQREDRVREGVRRTSDYQMPRKGQGSPFLMILWKG